MKADQTPAAFKAVARNIALGVFDLVHSLDDLVAHALIGIDQHDAAALREYLPQLIDAHTSADDLKEFWSSMPSDIHFNDGEVVRKFLAALLERIERQPYLVGPEL